MILWGEPGARTVTRVHLLIVGEVAADAEALSMQLGEAGSDVAHVLVGDEAAMRAALAAHDFDVVLCDWSGPKLGALSALAILRDLQLDVPLVVVSGKVDEEMAVEAMRAGARDYVLKGNLARLRPAVDRELRERKGREARRRAEAALRASEEARRRGEEQLRQSQKMEAVGRLAGGVAHDFNNALSVVLTYGELLLGAMKPDDPMRGDVLEIKTAALRAATLTRQLLVFARRKALEPRVLDMNETLVAMHEMLVPLVGEDVKLIWQLAPTVDAVWADVGSIEQVVMNLVVNARDAMPRGGTLTVATANVVLDEAEVGAMPGALAGPHVMFSVTDTGIGMDGEVLSRIFEPFFTTKDPSKGTGLGLPTVHGIVRQSDGCIRVRSLPGQGATFEIYLPVTTGVGAARGHPAPGPQDRETILLAEDDVIVRTIARTILAQLGYRVLDTRDPSDALRLVREHSGPIHLLLTDVVMPQMSGPELARQVSALRPETRVLFMSGHTDDRVLRHGVDVSTAAYIQKPITPERLAAKVRQVLEGK